MTEKIDVTELKHLLVAQELHEKSPMFFNYVEEVATKSECSATWTMQEFESAVFRTQKNQQNNLSLEDIMTLFEMLDSDKDFLID